MGDEKKARGKNWKSYCNSICTNCNSLFFVTTAQRYCYEDKYDLPQVPKKIIYKSEGINHIVATGVIDHETSTNGNTHETTYWEDNLNVVKHNHPDNYTYIIKEVCKELKISYRLFMRKLNKIKKEMSGGSIDKSNKKKMKKNTRKKEYSINQLNLFRSVK